MKRSFLLPILAAILGVATQFACEASTTEANTTAVQALDKRGCSLIGSWYGYNGLEPTVPTWMTTVSGQSESSGAIVLELFSFDGTFGGAFPVVKNTLLRGIWERLDGNSFRITVLGAGVGADGNTITLGRFDAVDVLSDDCNTITVTKSVLNVFYPANVDPFTGTPLFPVPLPDHMGYRMRFQ